MLLAAERARNVSFAAKRPLLTSLRSKADLSVSAGALVELGAGAGVASALIAAGAASLLVVSRAFWTARTVAPSRTAPEDREKERAGDRHCPGYRQPAAVGFSAEARAA